MSYRFAENSWLIRTIVIPYGNACDLSFNESALRDFLGSGWDKISQGKIKPLWVEYSPHNIDSLKQAMCLRELFLGWANNANYCLNYD